MQSDGLSWRHYYELNSIGIAVGQYEVDCIVAISQFAAFLDARLHGVSVRKVDGIRVVLQLEWNRNLSGPGDDLLGEHDGSHVLSGHVRELHRYYGAVAERNGLSGGEIARHFRQWRNRGSGDGLRRIFRGRSR